MHRALIGLVELGLNELARLDAVGTATEIAGSMPAGDVDARMALARRWDNLINQVRALPGFQDFARVPAASRLRRAAAGGTVVVLNVSRWRCDALLITDTTIRIQELPHLTHDTVIGRANTYLHAVQESGIAGLHPHSARIALEQAISTTLEWLWDTIAEPVLDALGHHRTPDSSERWPRVWVVSDWRSDLAAAARRRLPPPSRRPQRPGSGGLLVCPYGACPVGQPDRARPAQVQQAPADHLACDSRTTPATSRRRGARLAHQPVQRGTDHGACYTAATHAAILENLANHAWTHASCHGTQNLADPVSAA
jgi:hypothetical protein